MVQAAQQAKQLKCSNSNSNSNSSGNSSCSCTSSRKWCRKIAVTWRAYLKFACVTAQCRNGDSRTRFKLGSTWLQAQKRTRENGARAAPRFYPQQQPKTNNAISWLTHLGAQWRSCHGCCCYCCASAAASCHWHFNFTHTHYVCICMFMCVSACVQVCAVNCIALRHLLPRQ